jgi:UV DNA damage endonuclease
MSPFYTAPPMGATGTTTLARLEAAAPMRVGYACIHTRLPSPARTVRLANATPERLREVTSANLDALEAILRWNRERGIRVFRISSNTIPYGSHRVNTMRWWDEFAPRLAALGRLLDGVSVSMHPGQYTVLGSVRPDVVDASIAELEYQARLLRSLGLDSSHKLVLHPSGTVERFAAGVARLSEDARARLTAENDERRSLAEALLIADMTRLPVVFDVFHHRLKPSLPDLDVRAATLAAAETWSSRDGRQEVHFSTQDPGKRPGAHSPMLDADAFTEFAAEVADLPLDCIVEVKDKEVSALRAQRLLDDARPPTPRPRPGHGP